MTDFTPDVIVVGAGLAGLVATHELALAGKRVLVLDQENRRNVGAQAWWSLGGLLFVDSPEQRRMGIKDSPELAWQDWQGSAQFDRLGDGTDGPGRGEDFWPQQWARAYVDFCVSDVPRYQLLFQRSVPGFAPSPESYELAVSALEVTRELLARNGVHDPRYLDIWTAVMTGLVDQQVSNDPGGDRWTRLVDEVAQMFLARCATGETSS